MCVFMYNIVITVHTIDDINSYINSSTYPYIYLLELSPNASNSVIASVNNSKTTPHVFKTDRCRPPTTTYLPIQSIDRSSYHIHQPYSIDIIIIIINTIPNTIPYSRYYLRRLKHPAGEVTCLSIDEYVSLPPDSSLSVKYHSAVVAQGFMSIKKM
jgi:hypothetical protein